VKITPLEIGGLQLVELDIHGDARGFFVERFHAELFRPFISTQFVQDNHSRSAPGVLRGLHFQYGPPQGKLVGVVHGAIFDVAVDIRPESPTFGRSYGVELSDLNGRLLWVPPGFAHGFCVIGDGPADVLYKVDAAYAPTGEGGIRWNDPELSVKWPVEDPTVSARDMVLPTFAEYQVAPPAWSQILNWAARI
jgi:dTDP-4-dehydrorhamnose 3,5-epimerase